MKGRNSSIISLRLPDSVYAILSDRATNRGLSIGQYIQGQIIHSVNATKPQLYDPLIHKAGDRVLVRKGRKLIETTVPEIDADGNVI